MDALLCKMLPGFAIRPSDDRLRDVVRLGNIVLLHGQRSLDVRLGYSLGATRLSTRTWQRPGRRRRVPDQSRPGGRSGRAEDRTEPCSGRRGATGDRGERPGRRSDRAARGRVLRFSCTSKPIISPLPRTSRTHEKRRPSLAARAKLGPADLGIGPVSPCDQAQGLQRRHAGHRVSTESRRMTAAGPVHH